MAISQVIWSLDDKIQLQPAELTNEKELEDLLAEHIEILNPDCLCSDLSWCQILFQFYDNQVSIVIHTE